MQPSRLRLVCRAHNRFSPSTILRQHFLSFDRLVPHHERYSSSISDTAQGRGEETYTESSAAPKHNVSEQSHAQPQTTRPPKVVIRKTYLKEAIAHPDGRVSKSIHQGKHARDLHLAQIQNVLESTKRLCSRNGDYDATLLEPEWDKPYINDKRLPWTIPLKERPTDPMDRYVYRTSCLIKRCLMLREQAQSRNPEILRSYKTGSQRDYCAGTCD